MNLKNLVCIMKIDFTHWIFLQSLIKHKLWNIEPVRGHRKRDIKFHEGTDYDSNGEELELSW